MNKGIRDVVMKNINNFYFLSVYSIEGNSNIKEVTIVERKYKI